MPSTFQYLNPHTFLFVASPAQLPLSPPTCHAFLHISLPLIHSTMMAHQVQQFVSHNKPALRTCLDRYVAHFQLAPVGGSSNESLRLQPFAGQRFVASHRLQKTFDSSLQRLSNGIRNREIRRKNELAISISPPQPISARFNRLDAHESGGNKFRRGGRDDENLFDGFRPCARGHTALPVCALQHIGRRENAHQQRKWKKLQLAGESDNTTTRASTCGKLADHVLRTPDVRCCASRSDRSLGQINAIRWQSSKTNKTRSRRPAPKEQRDVRLLIDDHLILLSTRRPLK